MAVKSFSGVCNRAIIQRKGYRGQNTNMATLIPAAVDAPYQGIKQLVDSARSQVLTQVNQALVLTYWHIGKAIKTQVLQRERAAYGAGVLKQLAERLTQDYGSGFS